MSIRDSLGGKGGRCVRLTTYQRCSAERQEIRGLNLPEIPWAISTACCGRDQNFFVYILVQLISNAIQPRHKTAVLSIFELQCLFLQRHFF